MKSFIWKGFVEPVPYVVALRHELRNVVVLSVVSNACASFLINILN